MIESLEEISAEPQRQLFFIQRINPIWNELSEEVIEVDIITTFNIEQRKTQ